jgi:hypothetical protein
LFCDNNDSVEFISFRHFSVSFISKDTPVAAVYDPDEDGYKQREVEWNYGDEEEDR